MPRRRSCFDLRARTWSDDICRRLGIDRGLLAPLTESEALAGGLREDAARALGLPAGIAVAVGGADAPAAALGLGLAREEDAGGTVLISLGTGGQVLAPVASAEDRSRTAGSTACATSYPASGA